jgi:hypothetical protein
MEINVGTEHQISVSVCVATDTLLPSAFNLELRDADMEDSRALAETPNSLVLNLSSKHAVQLVHLIN